MTKKAQKPLSDDALSKAVRDAFEKLRKDGLEPSARNVIALTGGKQSRVLAAIQAVRDEEEARRKRMEAVPPIPSDLSDALESIWEVAWKAADKNAAEARNSFAMRIEHLEKRNEECMTALTQMEEENERLSASNTELEGALAAAFESKFGLEKEVEHLQLRLEERADLMRFVEEKMGRASKSEPVKKAPSKVMGQTGELPFDDLGPATEKGACS